MFNKTHKLERRMFYMHTSFILTFPVITPLLIVQISFADFFLSSALSLLPEVKPGKLSHEAAGIKMAASSVDATSDSELESIKNLTDVSEIQKALEKLNTDEVTSC